MGERTSHPPGTISWVDLATSDAPAAKRFYTELFGWTARDNEVPGGGTYTMLLLGGRAAAGLYELSDEMRERGVPPHWMSYVTVGDADATAALAVDAGGQVQAGPFDVLQDGRMALLQDPQGAMISVWEPREHIGAGIVNVPGALTWNDLTTPDVEASEAFYAQVFGWTFETANDANPRYDTIRNGATANGGILERQMPEQPTVWTTYFAVADLEEAVRRAEGLGATTWVSGQPVPGGAFAILADPQGAAFALFAGQLDD
jgi:uncharacterized protein